LSLVVPRETESGDAHDLALLAGRRRRRLRRNQRGPRPRRIALIAAFVLLAAGVGTAIVAAAAGPGLIAQSCTLSSLKPIALGSNSFVTSSRGSLLGVIPAKKNRQRLSLR
jgi:hypothetical protein